LFFKSVRGKGEKCREKRGGIRKKIALGRKKMSSSNRGKWVKGYDSYKNEVFHTQFMDLQMFPLLV